MLIQVIIPGNPGLHSGPFTADTVLAQMTFRKSCFRVKLLEPPQCYHYQ